MYKLCFILHLVTAVCASVVFQDCGSAYDLEAVNIAGCGRTLPCYITLGEATPVSVHFYADFPSFNLDQKVVININFIDMATEVTPEPCEIAECPVLADFESSFAGVMNVPRNMALNTRGWLRWRVFNERGVLVLCYSVLVHTQSKLQKMLRQHLGAALTLDSAEDIATIDFSKVDLSLMNIINKEINDDSNEQEILAQNKEVINSNINRTT